MASKAGLRGEADRRICGAEPGICPSLHNFEEKTTFEIFRVNLEVLASVLPIVEHVVCAQALERVRRQVDAGFEVIVIILWDRQSMVHLTDGEKMGA